MSISDSGRVVYFRHHICSFVQSGIFNGKQVLVMCDYDACFYCVIVVREH